MYMSQPPEVGDSVVITTTEKKGKATAVVTDRVGVVPSGYIRILHL